MIIRCHQSCAKRMKPMIDPLWMLMGSIRTWVKAKLWWSLWRCISSWLRLRRRRKKRRRIRVVRLVDVFIEKNNRPRFRGRFCFLVCCIIWLNESFNIDPIFVDKFWDMFVDHPWVTSWIICIRHSYATRSSFEMCWQIVPIDVVILEQHFLQFVTRFSL